MKKIKGIIFDLDGTIISSFIDFSAMKKRIEKLAEKYNMKVPSIKLPALEMIEIIYKKNKENKNKEKFKEEAEKIIIEEETIGMKKAFSYPDMIVLLKKLKKNGIKIGIITRNCRKVSETVIKKFSIPYDVVLTRDDVKKVKPHTYHLKEVLKKMGVKKENAVIVGDHYFDILCGKKAGILTCGIVRDGKFENLGNLPPDFVFESGKEIEYLTGLKKFKSGKLPAPFLEYLLKKYTSVDKNVIKGAGIGIDCAVFKVKSDILHSKSDPIILVREDIGFYLININANDICVSGAKPEYFLPTLIFPENVSFKEVEEVFSQISYECKKSGIKWIGGHTEIASSVKSVICSGFMLGVPVKKTKSEKIKKGDKVFIVKEAGIEGASIIVREKYEYLKRFFSEKYLKKVKNSIRKPGIGISDEGIFLWRNFKIKLMHDPTEGGISTALYELSKISGRKIYISPEKIPFYPPAVKLCKIFNLDVRGLISSGCIIGITSEKEIVKMEKIYRKRKIKFSVLGEIKEKGYGVFTENGTPFVKFEKDELVRL